MNPASPPGGVQSPIVPDHGTDERWGQSHGMALTVTEQKRGEINSRAVGETRIACQISERLRAPRSDAGGRLLSSLPSFDKDSDQDTNVPMHIRCIDRPCLPWLGRVFAQLPPTDQNPDAKTIIARADLSKVQLGSVRKQYPGIQNVTNLYNPAQFSG